ncbi:hypothetical protein JL100_021645 [Skermanella mucosa]|uniref:hypothetical protein n=1 Tax=Skermanella mucosa TaxID=1789672 RepID=UPI00192C57C6|nr:hypothetical protein [Skermanella mucosa]UEM19675.1 hypothetical protein JL100_021645 [Skermanella mucosa]
MKNLFRNAGAIAGILFGTLVLAGCAETPDPVLETAQTPLMLGDSSADRIVSLQTRTMLAGLACGRVWGDPTAFARYASFTNRNAAILRRSQHELADRMGGMAEFDKMHTRISNGESLRLLAMGDQYYCSEMRGPFYTAVAMGPDELARQSQVAQVGLR